MREIVGLMGEAAVDPELLFIQTLEDLHRSINSLDEYDVLRSSLLMRQLLLDATPLVNQVNRTHRLKIEYYVTEVAPPAFPGMPPLEVWSALDGISPHLCPPKSAPVLMRWDKFQKMVVATSGGHNHTVHDIIDYVAHIAGGVHMGTPRDEKTRCLASLNGRMPFLNINVVVASLRAIGRVILDGLSELKDIVLGVAKFENGTGTSIYLNLVIEPMPGGQENYIFDLGTEADKNRISVFVDAHGELCLRIFSASRNNLTLRAGTVAGAFRYGEPMSLCCEIGQQGDSVLVNLDSCNWGLTRVFQGIEGPQFKGEIPIVLGSDIRSRAQTHMIVMTLALITNVSSRELRIGHRAYLAQLLENGYDWGLYYEPGAFHHSCDHPNFPPIVSTERETFGPDAVIRVPGLVGTTLVSSSGPPPRRRILRAPPATVGS